MHGNVRTPPAYFPINASGLGSVALENNLTGEAEARIFFTDPVVCAVK